MVKRIIKKIRYTNATRHASGNGELICRQKKLGKISFPSGQPRLGIIPPEGAENWDIVLSGGPLYFIHAIQCNVELLFLWDPFFGWINLMMLRWEGTYGGPASWCLVVISAQAMNGYKFEKKCAREILQGCQKQFRGGKQFTALCTKKNRLGGG